MSIVLTAPDSNGGFVAYDTTSLREIEQEVARRTGPFRVLQVTNPQPGEPPGPDSTATQIVAWSLRSSIDLGGYEDMYVLRRGRLADGTRLPQTGQPFDVADRVRLVRNYLPNTGILEVDDAYNYIPYDAEEIELHHLHPEAELRPAVLGGLRRCFMVDRFPLPTVTASLYGIMDLTSLAPWLTARDQIYGVDLQTGAPAVGWQVEPYAGGLSIRLGEWAPGVAAVLNRRPSVTMTFLANGNGGNGPVVRSGNANEPWDDEDRFPVPLDYASAAGHIECWRTARPRMTLLAQTGMWPDQKEAAAEFTRISTVFFDPPRHENALPMAPRYWDSSLSNTR